MQLVPKKQPPADFTVEYEYQAGQPLLCDIYQIISDCIGTCYSLKIAEIPLFTIWAEGFKPGG